MKKNKGNFLFETIEDKEFLSIPKDAKYIFDTVVLGFFVLMSLTLALLIFFKIEKLISIESFILLVVLFGFVFKASEFKDKILEPYKHIVLMDRKNNTLSFRTGYSNSQNIDIDKIKALNYTFIKRIYRSDFERRFTKMRYHAEIYAVLINREKIKILIINTSHIFDVGPIKMENELRERAVQIVEGIAIRIKKPYYFKGKNRK